MNKEQLIEILEACLMISEGLTCSQVINLGLDPYNTKTGRNLYNYLKNKVEVTA